MTTAVSGLFAGISKAQVTAGGKFFHAGNFVTVIKKVIVKKTRNSGNGFIVEHKVIAVRDTAGEENPLRPGVDASHVITDGGKRQDMFLPNVKLIVTQLAQILAPDFNPETTSEDEWARLLDKATGADQCFAGLLVNVVATKIVTREGKPFTRIGYERGYSYRELRAILAALQQPEELTFPDGGLQKLIDAEVAVSAV